ncbi:type II toxin-antitoxin system VapC family toxin [Candidatus Lokiarchaeum ossiferum]|uniref:type II toxin-antitoxin system VapC family toxin n=1 Tax=Candidatus Lokiarchaeum ossiferum TaxID=2951803 RepID=UPI00352D403B
MIICDTTVLIDILRKKPSIMDSLRGKSQNSLFTTEISVMELFYGLYSNKFYDFKREILEKRKQAISELLHHFIVLPFDRKSAIITAKLMGNLQKSGKMIDFRDGMIAGISIANNITNILTKNVKHFKRISELKIISY